MRYFKIESLSVETAGQSSDGAIIGLAGIANGRQFRDAVLKQREVLVGTKEKTRPADTTAGGANLSADTDSVTKLLKEIRDSIQGIANRMDQSTDE